MREEMQFPEHSSSTSFYSTWDHVCNHFTTILNLASLFHRAFPPTFLLTYPATFPLPAFPPTLPPAFHPTLNFEVSNGWRKWLEKIVGESGLSLLLLRDSESSAFQFLSSSQCFCPWVLDLTDFKQLLGFLVMSFTVSGSLRVRPPDFEHLLGLPSSALSLRALPLRARPPTFWAA